MVCLIVISLCVHINHKPYSDWATNVVANTSLATTLLISVINTMWATLSYFGATFNESETSRISNGFIILEIILSQGFCLAVVLVCCIWFLKAYLKHRFKNTWNMPNLLSNRSKLVYSILYSGWKRMVSNFSEILILVLQLDRVSNFHIVSGVKIK